MMKIRLSKVCEREWYRRWRLYYERGRYPPAVVAQVGDRVARHGDAAEDDADDAAELKTLRCE